MLARPAYGPDDLGRPSGDGGRTSRDPSELLERHGAALFALALLLVQDPDRAEAIAADAILDACAGPCHVSQGADRWELARYVYVRSARVFAGSPPSSRSAVDPPPSADVALALAIFGGHTYTEIAALVGLAPCEAADHLRSSLLPGRL